MASSSRPRSNARDRRRALGFLSLLALAAVGIGIAGILLLPSGPGAAPGGPGTFSQSMLSLTDAGELIGVCAIGLVLLLVYMALAGPGGTVPKRFFTLILVYLLVSIGFLALVHLIGPTVLPATSTGMVGTNTTQPNGGANVSANQTPLNSSTVITPQYSPAFWLVVLGAVVATIVGLGVALWYVGRPTGANAGIDETNRDQVGAALEQALRSLDGATDPRTVLIALYAQLLSRIGTSLPELDAATPREIEQACVRDLGIPPGPAAELRVLFEQARYSTLPLGGADVDRARTALRQAMDGLTLVRGGFR